MNSEEIIREAQSVASEFCLKLEIIDVTDNVVDMRLCIDAELFIPVYANQSKDKLNLNVIFKNRRLFGHDSEGGRTHIHPFDDPESHSFTDKKPDLRNVVTKALKYLEEREIL